MSAIVDLRAREILDSRGNPTLEVDVHLESGAFGRAAVPSGASTGSYEATEMRDGDTRYHGKGVLRAIDAVNHEIFDALCGMNGYEQTHIDHALITLDGTPQKSRLGANSLLGVSLAVARAAANDLGVPLYRYLGGLNISKLPKAMMNVINGGAHASHGLSIQEFMIIPQGAPTFAESVRMGAEVFHTLKSILSKRDLSTTVGDEGGFAPPLKGTEAALDILIEAIQAAGYTPGTDMLLALDVAANELYHEGIYHMDGKTYTTDALVVYYETLVKSYPIVSIEDGMQEDDFHGWHHLTKSLGSHVQIVGDDLFVTQKKRLQKGIDDTLANAILIKPNQVGTLTETMDTITLAQSYGMKTIMSHRSGETEDTIIADLAVGLGTDQIKTGSLSRSDRTAKYNQLMRIEEELQL